MLSIEILRLIWWALIGVLLMGFAVTDGFDFGVATLLPFVTRDEVERRIVLGSIGPFWEGNQVWIILGAGALFAAWPFVYAVAFSGYYFLILLLLLTMGISRPVSFKYRNKLSNWIWRRVWDWVVFICGGICPALIFGILMGSVLTGAPFHFDNALRLFYDGNFFDFFNPFALWCGLTSLALLVMHGGLYLAMKTSRPIRERAIRSAKRAALCFIFLFAGGGLWVAQGLKGYQILSGVDPAGFSNPLNKIVITQMGAWLNNYAHYPILLAVPSLGFLGALGVLCLASFGNSKLAFVSSALSIIGVIATVGVSMFPFILPSSTHLSSSLLIWDASSSRLTLLTMLFAVIIFLPLILFYTSWVYYALRGKVSRDMIEDSNHHSPY